MYVSNDWNKMFQAGLGTIHKVAPVNLSVNATVVEVKTRAYDERYGEYVQGDDEVYVIFQVGDKFYKKTGTMDSYDENFTWDGPVVEVFGTTKTVTVFVPR